MDAGLLDEAKRAGAAVLQPARCERIRTNSVGEMVQLTVRDLLTNRSTIFASSHVLLADGKASLLPNRPRPTKDFGIKVHFLDVAAPPGTIGLFGVRGHYGGVAPIEGGRFNAAFSIPAANLDSAAGDLDRLFEGMVQENSPLPASSCGQAHRSMARRPTPAFPRRRSLAVARDPLGNAAAALEPIGGEGMGLARCRRRACRRIIDRRPHGDRSPGIAKIFRSLVACAPARLPGRCENDLLPALRGRWSSSWRPMNHWGDSHCNVLESEFVWSPAFRPSCLFI